MLVLSRRIGETVVIDNGMVEVTVTDIIRSETGGYTVKLGFKAPKHISIHRQEVQQRVDLEGRKKS
jgi:carbon storage regulator